MFHNGRDWVEDTDDYGFTVSAKEIAAAGVFPGWKKTGINRWHLYLDPVAKAEINCSLDGVFSVSLFFQEDNIILGIPFYTLEAAESAAQNKLSDVLTITSINLQTGIEALQRAAIDKLLTRKPEEP